jgi:hypothetical protein
VDTYEPLSAELADFIQALRAGRSLDWQTLLGKNVVRITEAADQSLRDRGSEVTLRSDLFAAMRPRTIREASRGVATP